MKSVDGRISGVTLSVFEVINARPKAMLPRKTGQSDKAPRVA